MQSRMPCVPAVRLRPTRRYIPASPDSQLLAIVFESSCIHTSAMDTGQSMRMWSQGKLRCTIMLWIVEECANVRTEAGM